MKLLVIGAGMMGSAAAYDMARSPLVETVTLADCDLKRAQRQATRLNKLADGKKIRPAKIDAASHSAAAKLMRGHNAVLSAVPYFYNLGLCKAAIEAKCHFADLGGNNVVVRQEYALGRQAHKRGVAIAPDCGLSPGMASILGGELMRQIGGQADALKIYVGGLPKDPQPPFHYQLLFSVEGLINEYVEPALVLRGGKIAKIEPLTEPEDFHIAGFDKLTAFHTSGGTSTLPETFAGSVGECFEKTLRTPSHYAMVRSLYDLGFFSNSKMKIGKNELAPRELTAKLFVEKFTSDAPDICIMRVEAHRNGSVASYSLVDYYDPAAQMTAMMRTTAWPASIVVMMMASGEITKRGGIKQETDVPAQKFLQEMAKRGIRIEHQIG
ncbi:MAG TPA: saccharopine dehydrogenase C-terminal domain-containing protein [Terriglobales bacterium]|jgi:lysine 6-dehydrogenase|nr:saccharopine dehydrogenase C-terminal domain-containing protein [Terriglobales bacterium]